MNRIHHVGHHATFVGMVVLTLVDVNDDFKSLQQAKKELEHNPMM